ncbi:MAG: hypothetical protein KAS70_05940 [Planctomycetes bacterium]|nr:hypothetical protein [Planctomycetota bacterium]MCK5578993.1 hypothetical protein [Planctomycetota bacterium]
MPENFKVIDTKKYMWDGKIYEQESEANNVAEGYKKDKFEIKIFSEESKFFVYSRRVAAVETPAEGQ